MMMEILATLDWSRKIPAIHSTFPDGHPEGLKHQIRNSYHEASFAISDNETMFLLITDETMKEVKEFKDETQP
jgi:hypothetical protein